MLMDLDTTIFASNSTFQIIIIMVAMFGIAFTIARFFQIKNWKAIFVMYAIILILAYACNVLAQIYSIFGYLIVAIVVYSEYMKHNGSEVNE